MRRGPRRAPAVRDVADRGAGAARSGDQGRSCCAQIALHDTVPVIPGLLSMTHVRNTGTAFGFLNGIDFPYKWVVVTVAAVLALVAIAVYAGKFAGESILARAGLAMVLAGAVGNLIDRARLGYVVDFVDVHYAGWHFWAFNVADSAITVGAIALILDIVRSPRHVPEAV